MKTRYFVIAGSILALIGSSAPILASSSDKDTSAKKTDKPAASKETGDAFTKLLTLDYVNAEVTDVMRALSTQSGVNVAVSPNVKGQVTVHLTGKTVDESMKMVANLAGLGARRVNDTYVVAPRADMKAMLERMGITKIVPLTYMDPKAAAEMATGIFPDLTAHPQGKGVALVGAGEDIDGAEKLVRENDRFSPEDVRVTERLEVKHIPASQAATALAKATPGVSAEEAGGGIVLSGPKGLVEGAKHNLEMIDVRSAPDVDLRVYNIKFSTAPDLIPIVLRTVPDVEIVPGTPSYAPPKPQFNPISSNFAGGGSNSSSSSGGASGSSGSGNSGSGSSGSGMSGNGVQANVEIPGAGPNGTSLSVPRNALSLLLKGPAPSLDQAMKVLTLMDVAPRQMMIEAKVVETSPSTVEQYGLSWSWTSFGAVEAPPGTQIPGPLFSPGSPGGNASSFTTRPNAFGAFSRLPWSFQSILHAMVEKQEAKILANPQIAVVNDQDASIFIGDTLRFNSLASSSATAGNQFTVVETPVGIILLVHPRINDDGFVTLRVHPVVSTVTAITDGLPQTSSREAETIVRLKDGDTLVIGGLIRDEDIKSMTKIPILGDLPLIGQLFRDHNNSHRRTEVMVALTIHVLK